MSQGQPRFGTCAPREKSNSSSSLPGLRAFNPWTNSPRGRNWCWRKSSPGSSRCPTPARARLAREVGCDSRISTDAFGSWCALPKPAILSPSKGFSTCISLAGSSIRQPACSNSPYPRTTEARSLPFARWFDWVVECRCAGAHAKDAASFLYRSASPPSIIRRSAFIWPAWKTNDAWSRRERPFDERGLARKG